MFYVLTLLYPGERVEQHRAQCELHTISGHSCHILHKFAILVDPLTHLLQVIEVLARGERARFTLSCDVWSYGLLLWELYNESSVYGDLTQSAYGDVTVDLLNSYFIR
eukprot:sb/3477540/